MNLQGRGLLLRIHATLLLISNNGILTTGSSYKAREAHLLGVTAASEKRHYALAHLEAPLRHIGAPLRALCCAETAP